MFYILSHPRLTKSAKLLAQEIGELFGEQILVRTQPTDIHTCIIRYGNSAPIFEKEVEYNSPEHIRMAGNKGHLSAKLINDDFPHVIIFHPHEMPERFPVALRTELNRGGGIGIEIIKEEDLNNEDAQPYLNYARRNYHWSYWYNFQFELGVHILGGEIVRVFKKVRQEGLEEEKYPIRNTQRGYSFKLRNNWQERYGGLEKFVAKLYEIFPIQFARLDVGFDKETGGYRLIEINSAPDLSQNANTLKLYAEFLVDKIFRKI